MSSGQLLTVPEDADLLQAKTSTVYSRAKQRLLPAVALSIGKRKEYIRFRRSSIEAWIEEHERQVNGNSFTKWDKR